MNNKYCIVVSNNGSRAVNSLQNSQQNTNLIKIEYCNTPNFRVYITMDGFSFTFFGESAHLVLRKEWILLWKSLL